MQSLMQVGAVSQSVVMQMAKGALLRSNADIALSVSGIAGPEGGSIDKPVGLVWFGFAFRDRSTIAHRFVFSGDRQQIRDQAVSTGLSKLLQLLQDNTI